MFPRIPGGCRHAESDENLVLSNFYLIFGDIFFDIFEMFFEFLFNMTPAVFRPGDIHMGNQFYILKLNFLS